MGHEGSTRERGDTHHCFVTGRGLPRNPIAAPRCGRRQVLGTNLVGPFLVAQVVARSMVRGKRPGSIINISSSASLAPSAGEHGRSALFRCSGWYRRRKESPSSPWTNLLLPPGVAGLVV